MTFEQLKSDFAFDMMWGAVPREKLSVTELEDVLLAVRKAYADMSVRSIKGFSKVKDEKKEELRENFAQKRKSSEKAPFRVLFRFMQCHNRGMHGRGSSGRRPLPGVRKIHAVSFYNPKSAVAIAK